MDPNAICLLINGKVKDWRGLGRLERAELASCVGSRVGQGTARFRLMLLAVDTYRVPPGETEVQVYSSINGELIELVDVKPSPAPAAGRLLGELGAPAAMHVYSLEECAAANLRVPVGGSIKEAIYSNNGLAIAVVREPSGEAVVARIRGFEPMPAQHYLDEYVRFDAEAL